MSGRGPEPARTWHARQGRISALSRHRLDTLLSVHGVPPGLLDPVTAFGRAAPLIVELGSGLGDAAVSYAASHREHDLLACEIYLTGVARLLAGAQDQGLTNLRAYVGDGIDYVHDRVPERSVSEFHLWFPDPWPKNRHAKRRMVRPDILALLASRLVPGGVVRLASDHPAYIAHVREVVPADGTFVLREVDRPAWRPVTGFEAKGIAEGRPPVWFELRTRPDQGR